MPRGRPNAEQSADPKTNKMEAVRRAMDSLGYDGSPLEIQKFVKENFEVDMSANMISSYKSTLRNKAGLTDHGKKRGRPKKTDGVPTAVPTPHHVVTFHDAVPWKDLRTIKDMAARIGKKSLRELVEFLD